MNIFRTLKNQNAKTYKCLSCGKVFEFQINPFVDYFVPPKPICTRCASFFVVRWFGKKENNPAGKYIFDGNQDD